jgi:hypothetical protein
MNINVFFFVYFKNYNEKLLFVFKNIFVSKILIFKIANCFKHKSLKQHLYFKFYLNILKLNL